MGALRLFTEHARDVWRVTGAWAPLVAAGWLVRREYLVMVRYVGPAGPPARASDARWTRVEAQAEELVRGGTFPGTRAGIRRQLEEGQECWVAWMDGEPAHWRWESSRPAWLPYLGLSLRPQLGDLCVVDVYTRPRFRGRGLHTAGTLLALERARASKLTRLIGLVAPWNRSARHVMEVKTRRTMVGSVGFWNLGARRYFSRGQVCLEPKGFTVAAPARTARPGAETPRVRT